MPPKRQGGPRKARRWVFTYHLEEPIALSTDAEIAGNAEALIPPLLSGESLVDASFRWNDEDRGIRFYLAQLERTPTTGRIHWQGYIEFFTPYTMENVKRFFIDQRVCLQEAFAGYEDNEDYCSKVNGENWKRSDPLRNTPGPGGRIPGTDVVRYGEPAVDAMHSGKGRKALNAHEVATKIWSGKFAKVSDVLDGGGAGVVLNMEQKVVGLMMHAQRRKLDETSQWSFRAMEIEYWWGPPGCGKSQMCKFLYGDSCTVKSRPDRWFTGLVPGITTLIIEEFGGFEWSKDGMITFLNSVLAGQVRELEAKGCYNYNLLERVVFLSNMSPLHIFAKQDEWGNSIPWWGIDVKIKEAFLDRIYSGTVYEFHNHPSGSLRSFQPLKTWVRQFPDRPLPGAEDVTAEVADLWAEVLKCCPPEIIPRLQARREVQKEYYRQLRVREREESIVVDVGEVDSLDGLEEYQLLMGEDEIEAFSRDYSESSTF
jgi:hypothetical protein